MRGSQLAKLYSEFSRDATLNWSWSEAELSYAFHPERLSPGHSQLSLKQVPCVCALSLPSRIIVMEF